MLKRLWENRHIDHCSWIHKLVQLFWKAIWDYHKKFIVSYLACFCTFVHANSCHSVCFFWVWVQIVVYHMKPVQLIRSSLLSLWTTYHSTFYFSLLFSYPNLYYAYLYYILSFTLYCWSLGGSFISYSFIFFTAPIIELYIVSTY